MNAIPKSKILLIAPTPPPYGGMALQAAQLARLLREDGHSVDFFPSNFPCPLVVERIPYARTLYRLVAIWPKLWIAAGKADLIHVMAASWYYFFGVVYPAVIVSRIRRRRVVLNYRGGEAPAFFKQFGWLAGPALRLAGEVTAPSRFLSEEIGNRFAIPVAIVPNLLDTARFQFRRREQFAPKLLVSRHLEAIYDISTVVKAFAEIQRAFPSASLWIVGGGSQEADIRGQVKRLGLNHVRFFGSIPHAQLPALYEQCDIYLNASRVDNFPGALLEASAAGLAIVSTNAGGIPFIYENGISAVLVEVGDWKGLAGGVERILGDPEFARGLVESTGQLVSRAEWRNVRLALYESYARALSLSPAPGGMAPGLHQSTLK